MKVIKPNEAGYISLKTNRGKVQIRLDKRQKWEKSEHDGKLMLEGNVTIKIIDADPSLKEYFHEG